MAISDQTANSFEQGEVLQSDGRTFRKVSAFIGEGVEFKGSLWYHGSIRVDGVFDGDVRTEGSLLVGEAAVVRAKIRAGTVVCKGKIRGDIIAREKIELRATAMVIGSLTAPLLSIEEGARVNGEVSIATNGDFGLQEHHEDDHQLQDTKMELVPSAVEASAVQVDDYERS